ncbi:MAG: PspC domain-containing protein [Acidimicrobiales bacterium]|jgi:phage shock protein PspC (stress-responsive transcriptional regulator)
MTTTTTDNPNQETEQTEQTEQTEPAGAAEYHRDTLRRGGPGRMLAGVAVGLADYFDIDPTLVRVGFVVLSFLGGLAVPLYLAGWLLIPEEGAELSIAEELMARERVR